MTYRISRKKAFQWIVLTGAALISMRAYYVQEMVAMLFFAAVLVACMTGAVLIVLLLAHAGRTAFALAGVSTGAFGRAARRQWGVPKDMS
jgi:hypothetical protein